MPRTQIPTCPYHGCGLGVIGANIVGAIVSGFGGGSIFGCDKATPHPGFAIMDEIDDGPAMASTSGGKLSLLIGIDEMSQRGDPGAARTSARHHRGNGQHGLSERAAVDGAGAPPCLRRIENAKENDDNSNNKNVSIGAGGSTTAVGPAVHTLGSTSQSISLFQPLPNLSYVFEEKCSLHEATIEIRES